jgi:hypothetical protein
MADTYEPHPMPGSVGARKTWEGSMLVKEVTPKGCCGKSIEWKLVNVCVDEYGVS